MRWWSLKRNGKYVKPTDLERKIQQEEVRAQIVADRVRVTRAVHEILVGGKISELRSKAGE